MKCPLLHLGRVTLKTLQDTRLEALRKKLFLKSLFCHFTQCTLRGNFKVKIFPSRTEISLVLSRTTYLPSYLSAFPMSNRSSVDISTKVKIVDELRTCMLSVCTERERVSFSIYGDSMGSGLYLRLPQGASSITACDRGQRLSPFVTCQIGKHSYPAWKVSFSTPSFDIPSRAYPPIIEKIPPIPRERHLTAAIRFTLRSPFPRIVINFIYF